MSSAKHLDGGAHAFRIALLTPEFPTEDIVGGLGSYIRNFAAALSSRGHTVEIFVSTADRSSVEWRDGVRIEWVPAAAGLPSWLAAMARRTSLRLRLGSLVENVHAAACLRYAMWRRDREMPFNIVQSSDYGIPGFFVGRSSRRIHLVRCSWAADLFQECDGLRGVTVMNWLERRCIAKADAAYAPSHRVASHYRERYGLPVHVVRPPLPHHRVALPGAAGEPVEPHLLFLGRVCRRKGSETLAAALNLAWQSAPDLRMRWAGPESIAGTLDNYRRQWGSRSHLVEYLGVVPSSRVPALLRGARALVAPSLVDNLPNTAIESLYHGTPVVGTVGSSLDECVEDGRTGILVPINDHEVLATALVRAWRGEITKWDPAVVSPAIFASMTPHKSTEAFLAVALEVRALADRTARPGSVIR